MFSYRTSISVRDQPPATADGSDLIVKIRKFIALTEQYIFNSARNALFIPQIPLASLVRPRAPFTLPTSGFAHLTRRVRFESVESRLRFLRADGNNRVNMICSDINCF